MNTKNILEKILEMSVSLYHVIQVKNILTIIMKICIKLSALDILTKKI